MNKGDSGKTIVKVSLSVTGGLFHAAAAATAA